MATHLGHDVGGHGDEQDERRDDGPGAVLLDRPRRARDASGLLQLVEKPGCVRLRHGEQGCDERGIGHRLHGQPVEDGQDSIVRGREGRHGGFLARSGCPVPGASSMSLLELFAGPHHPHRPHRALPGR
jgi:hypothetical protein